MNFGRYTGTLYWGCPTCNVICQSHLRAYTRDIQCKSCRTTWYIGLTLWRKPRGPASGIPKDTLLIAEGFALRRLANRVFCDKCGKEMAEDKALEESPYIPVTLPEKESP